MPRTVDQPSKANAAALRFAAADWAAPALIAVFLVAAFLRPLNDLLHVWNTQEEYSFGYFLPPVCLYLIWQRRYRLARMPLAGSWSGALLVGAGLGMLVLGELSTMQRLSQYAFLTALAGSTLAGLGWPAFRVIAVPLAILTFMVPMPAYLLGDISQGLQLVSSELGVALIRLAGITVHLEGNVIDLGTMKLLVAEACSGLRYLLPLMTLGFIAAYLFRDRWWKRALVFLSTIPITILTNSLRIALVGILVEYHGRSMAEGFLHDFEGWAVFMLGSALLGFEMLLLARLGGRRLQEVLALDCPGLPPGVAPAARPLPAPLIAAGALLLAGAVAVHALPARSHQSPSRSPLDTFPLDLPPWTGMPDRIDPLQLDELRPSDYLLADYREQGATRAINLHISYYDAQSQGNSAHSPRACIPGGGWRLVELRPHTLDVVGTAAGRLRVNRAVIERADNRQLVYYWFQQRGRVMTNEYMVKLYIFWDALTRRRSDGAMVRLITRLAPAEAPEDADFRLARFAGTIAPLLPAYVPE